MTIKDNSVNKNSKESDIYKLFFAEDVFTLIFDELNRYVRQVGDHNFTASSGEMKIYWGLCMLMGIVKKLTNVMYWSTNESLHTPIFSELINRERFQLLSRYLHIANSKAAYPDDKLSRLRKLYDIITKLFSNVAEPGEVVSIDKALIYFLVAYVSKPTAPASPPSMVLKHINSVMRRGKPTNLICIQEQWDPLKVIFARK